MADDAATERELMGRFPGWLIWYGRATGVWWAYGGGRGLVEAATAEGLAKLLGGNVRDRKVTRLDGEDFPARAARRRLRAAVQEWGLEELAESGELVVSELVANAGAHAGPPITLTLGLVGQRLVIDVDDGSPTLPVRGRPGEDGGFGLTVVQALADVSVRKAPAGKTIRAMLPKA